MPQPTTEEDDQQDTKRARLDGVISPEVPPDLLDSLTFLQAFGEGAPAPIAELTPTEEAAQPAQDAQMEDHFAPEALHQQESAQGVNVPEGPEQLPAVADQGQQVHGSNETQSVAQVNAPIAGADGISTTQIPQQQAGSSGKDPPPVKTEPPDTRYPQPGAYTLREEALQRREAEGDISFAYVLNDDTAQNLIYLTGLKNIYGKQLPNMPKEYIVRLVMDRRHRSVALIKRNGTVIGGITYRSFPEQSFGEIAFCAVTSSEQVKGYGTRLMNQAKEAARSRDKLTHFLTYADNNAVGYFEKQGFTKQITYAKDRWYGWIKDYDGGTLMECVLHPKVNYSTLPEMVRAQRSALDARIRTLSFAHIVRPGLTHFKEREQQAGGKGKDCKKGHAGQKRQRGVAIETIPGVMEAGWSLEAAATTAPSYTLLVPKGKDIVEAPPTAANLTAFMNALLVHLRSQTDDAWPFLEPVSPADAPDYYEFIKDPMDLATMGHRLQDGMYITLDIFVADVKRIATNAKTYNGLDSPYTKRAENLEAAMQDFLTSHVIFGQQQQQMQVLKQ